MSTSRKPQAKRPSQSKQRGSLGIDELRPAPYPASDTSESKSITILKSLLNEELVKAEFQARDKRPNTDGYVDLVDRDGISLGQLDVQIKTLSGSNLKARSYPCKEGLLGYCVNGASRQVLLIGVDISGRQAFWLHLSREYIKGLSKKSSAKTISVKFPTENVISRDESYIERWVAIVKEHARRMHQFDPQIATRNNEEAVAALLAQSDPRTSASFRPEFIPTQYFLDELNRLLDHEFTVVKKFFYPQAWKLGIAISQFSKNVLCYALYPIFRGHNESLIRQVESSLWSKTRERVDKRGGFTVFSFFKRNPILLDPIKAARSQVHDLADQLINAHALQLSDVLLAREFLFSVIDRYRELLGLPEQDTYLINDVAFALYEYLPRFVEYALETVCPDRTIPAYLFCDNDVIDLDMLRLAFADKQAASSTANTTLITNRVAPSWLPALGSRRFPLGLFRRHLAFLSENNQSSIQRPYIKPTNLGGSAGASRMSSQAWLPIDFARNFKLVMSTFLTTYTQVVASNFPSLQKQLSYFDTFDRAIIVLRQMPAAFGMPWEAVTYELSSKCPSEPRYDVYCDGLDVLPKLPNHDAEHNVVIDGIEYEITGISSSICVMDFWAQPLFNEVYRVLQKRFQTYIMHDSMIASQ